MAIKALGILGKAFLMLVVILVLWIGANQIRTKPRPEVTNLPVTREQFLNSDVQWDNPLFQFIQNFDATKKPVAPEQLKTYKDLMIANTQYPDIPSKFSISSFFMKHLTLHNEALNGLGKNMEDDLTYLVASLKYSKNVLNQRISFLSFAMELSTVSATAKFLDDNKGKYLVLSSRSARDKLNEIKSLMNDIVDHRLELINGAIDGERLAQLALSDDLKLSDLSMADHKRDTRLTFWDTVGFLFYNEEATQNTVYDNFENLHDAAKCVRDFSCDQLCKTEKCQEVPHKSAGNFFLNPVGMYFTKFMLVEPRLLVKMSARFKEIKATSDTIDKM